MIKQFKSKSNTKSKSSTKKKTISGVAWSIGPTYKQQAKITKNKSNNKSKSSVSKTTKTKTRGTSCQDVKPKYPLRRTKQINIKTKTES